MYDGISNSIHYFLIAFLFIPNLVASRVICLMFFICNSVSLMLARTLLKQGSKSGLPG